MSNDELIEKARSQAGDPTAWRLDLTLRELANALEASEARVAEIEKQLKARNRAPILQAQMEENGELRGELDGLRRRLTELELLVGEGEAERSKLRKYNSEYRDRVMEIEGERDAALAEVERLRVVARHYPDSKPGPNDTDSIGRVLALGWPSKGAARWTFLHADALEDGDTWHPMPLVPDGSNGSE